MTEAEKQAMAEGQASTPLKTKQKRNARKQAVELTADELKQETSTQIGALASSVTNPMMEAVKRTASQQIMLATVQSVPDILADANAGLADFFDSFDSETLAFDLTMNQLPTTTKELLLTAGE